MREEWKLRRTNAPGITTPLIDKLIGVAKSMVRGRPKFAVPAAVAA